MTTYIYGLLDPRTNALRYIGKSNNPQVRWRTHISEGLRRTRNGRMAIWIKDLAKEGLEPEAVLIEAVERDWRNVEKEWIQKLRQLGYPLLNTAPGGGGKINENAPAVRTLKWWQPTSAPYGVKYIPKPFQLTADVKPKAPDGES